MSRREPLMVCAAPFWSGSTGAGLVAGFRAQGWLVQEVDIRNFTGQPGRGTAGRLVFKVQQKLALEAYRRQIVEDCRILKPDVFLTVKGAELAPDLISEISAMGIATVNFYPDYHFDYANFDQATIERYDHFVTTKSFQLEWLRERRGSKATHFVAHGYADAVHRPILRQVESSDYRADVGYAGNHSRHKADLLDALLVHRPATELLVTGPNWRNLDSRSRIADHLDGLDRRNLAFAEFLQRSRINLAFHYGKAANGWEDLVSTRSFEIPACGGFMLHIDNPEIREYYRVGEEIDVFSSAEEMADKVEFYLANDSVRQRICTAGHARAVPNYGCAKRAGEVLAKIGMGAAGERRA